MGLPEYSLTELQTLILSLMEKAIMENPVGSFEQLDIGYWEYSITVDGSN